VKHPWQILSTIGVRPGYDLRENRTIISLNRIAFVLFCFLVTSIVTNIILGSNTFIPVLSFHLFLIFLVYLINYFRLHFMAKSLLLIASLSLLTYMLSHGAQGSGLGFYFISLIVLPALLFRKRSIIIGFQLIIVLTLIFSRFYFNDNIIVSHDPPVIFRIFFVINSLYSCMLVSIGIFFFRNASTISEQELIEKNRKITSQYKDLKEINSQLKRVNNDLEQFAYVASHDLKEPLRMIASYSQLLTRKSPKDNEAQEFSNFILKSVQRMQQLINDLLIYTRIIHDNARFRKINTEKVISHVQFALKNEIAGCNASIHFNDLPDIKANENQIFQLFQNLISNSLKFCRKDATPLIEISCKERAKDWLFTYTDNGIGIDEDYFEKIFIIFQRLHTQEEYPGTGLGLALVKKIVEHHGGAIKVESEKDHGTIFSFTISK
jgi:signal transduction histidine kinase